MQNDQPNEEEQYPFRIPEPANIAPNGMVYRFDPSVGQYLWTKECDDQ